MTCTKKGLHAYRLEDNPEEKAFAKAWAEQNMHGKTLAYLLDRRSNRVGYPPDPSDRDQVVAATVVQWLGSPVGQAFLSDLGYEKQTKTARRK